MASTFRTVLELPEAVFQLKYIGTSPEVRQDGLLMAILDRRVIVINFEMNEILYDIKLPMSILGGIVDCVYDDFTRSFCILLTGSSLIIIPRDCARIDLLAATRIPVQPRKLLQGSKGHVFVCCDGGEIFLSSLKSFGVPLQPMELSALFAFTASNSKSSVMETIPCVAGYEEVMLSSWVIGTAGVSDASSGNWLSSKPTASGSVELSMEMILYFTSLHYCNGCLIVTNLLKEKSAKKSIASSIPKFNDLGGRWLKISQNGNTLIERDIDAVISAIDTGGVLYLLHSDRLTGWDFRFGVQLFSVLVPHISSVGKLLVTFSVSNTLPPLPGSLSVTQQNYNLSGPTQTAPPTIILCSNLSSSGAVLSAYSFPVPTSGGVAVGDLCSALGKLTNVGASECRSNSQAENSVMCEDQASNGKILGSLPAPLKRKLQKAQKLCDEQIRLEREELLQHEAGRGDADKLGTRKRRFYLDVPREASEAFLARFVSCGEKYLETLREGGQKGGGAVFAALAPLASDWEVLLVLLRDGSVSLAEQKLLVPLAAACGRADVLVQIARYAADLTERQSLAIIAHCAALDSPSLAHLSLAQGVLSWSPKPFAAAAAKTSEEKSKKKKSRKSRSGEVDSEVDGSVAVPFPSGLSQLAVVRLCLEAILLRNGAFSSVLLTEALRSSMSAKVAALLLRILVHSLRGLSVAWAPLKPLAKPPSLQGVDSEVVVGAGDCRGVDVAAEAAELHLGVQFEEEQVRRAVVWAEAVLDAHFAGTAMNAVNHAPTRRAVACALEVVAPVEDASGRVEAALGLVTHIMRMSKYGGLTATSAVPTGAIYSVEHLSL